MRRRRRITAMSGSSRNRSWGGGRRVRTRLPTESCCHTGYLWSDLTSRGLSAAGEPHLSDSTTQSPLDVRAMTVIGRRPFVGPRSPELTSGRPRAHPWVGWVRLAGQVQLAVGIPHVRAITAGARRRALWNSIAALSARHGAARRRGHAASGLCRRIDRAHNPPTNVSTKTSSV